MIERSCPHDGKSIGELEHVIEFLLIHSGPPILVVEVLAPSCIVASYGLQMSIGVGTDPHLFPRGRDYECLYTRQGLGILYAVTVCIEVFETTATAPAHEAGTCTIHSSKAGHGASGIPDTLGPQPKSARLPLAGRRTGGAHAGGRKAQKETGEPGHP